MLNISTWIVNLKQAMFYTKLEYIILGPEYAHPQLCEATLFLDCESTTKNLWAYCRLDQD